MAKLYNIKFDHAYIRYLYFKPSWEHQPVLHCIAERPYEERGDSWWTDLGQRDWILYYTIIEPL